MPRRVEPRGKGERKREGSESYVWPTSTRILLVMAESLPLVAFSYG